MFDIIGLFDNVGISIFGLRSPGFVQSRPKSGPAMGVLQSTNTLDEVRTVAAVAGDGVDTMSPGNRHQKHQQKIGEISRVLSYITIYMIYIDILILAIGMGHCPRPWKPHLSISVLPLNHAIFPMPLYFWARDSDMTHRVSFALPWLLHFWRTIPFLSAACP